MRPTIKRDAPPFIETEVDKYVCMYVCMYVFFLWTLIIDSKQTRFKKNAI